MLEELQAPPRSKLDVALDDFRPEERTTVLAMRFRDPETMWEWALWHRLQRRFAQIDWARLD